MCVCVYTQSVRASEVGGKGKEDNNTAAITVAHNARNELNNFSFFRIFSTPRPYCCVFCPAPPKTKPTTIYGQTDLTRPQKFRYYFGNRVGRS